MSESARVFTVAPAHRPTWELFQRVDIPGVRLEFVADGEDIPSNRMYTLLANEHACDIGELAFSTYLMAQDLGSQDIALPIFPARMIPHAGVWVREDADIHEPRDLVDKRVGCNSFATNYSVWWRGILAHQYDVPTQRITWVQSVAEHRADYQPPRRFPIEIVPGGTRSEALLAEGKIDAATTAGAGVVRRASGVRPLFADPYPEIRAYVQQYGFVPINTVITVSRKAADRNPDLPRRLLDALVAARPRESVAAHSGEPDLYTRLEQETGRSLTASGFRANRAAIQTMICYCYEQGIIKHFVDPEDRFLLTDS